MKKAQSEDDELLAVWKDEPIIGNKVDPREYYSGSTSPNPIAEVTSKGYKVYVEGPEGRQSPPPEWYPKPMSRSQSLLKLPKNQERLI